MSLALLCDMRLTGREEAPWPSDPGGIPASASGKKLYTEEKKGGEKSNTCAKCGPSQKKTAEKRGRLCACVRACVRPSVSCPRARGRCQEGPCELQKRSEAEGWKVQADSPRCHLHTRRVHGAPARERVKERRMEGETAGRQTETSRQSEHAV